VCADEKWEILAENQTVAETLWNLIKIHFKICLNLMDRLSDFFSDNLLHPVPFLSIFKIYFAILRGGAFNTRQ
jgi:hypothetical protein